MARWLGSVNDALRVCSTYADPFLALSGEEHLRSQNNNFGGWGSESNEEITDFLCCGWVRETAFFRRWGWRRKDVLFAPLVSPQSFAGVLKNAIKTLANSWGFKDNLNP